MQSKNRSLMQPYAVTDPCRLMQPYAVAADMAQLDAVAEEARFYALASLEQQCDRAMARLRELEAAQVCAFIPSCSCLDQCACPS